jgi:periplasmic protein TonB
MEDNQNMEMTSRNMDEIVFANRNKEYGAYFLRKKYNKYILIAFLISFVFMTIAVGIPVIDSYLNRAKLGKSEKKEVTAVIEKVFKEDLPPPPPPPPPPTADVVKSVKFTAPVVVDEVKDVKTEFAMPEDVDNSPVGEVGPVKLEVEQHEDKVVQEEPVFVVVEENATFQGGDINTFRSWVMEHTRYPESAREMGIEGKVIIQFVINSAGNVENVKVLRELDPACDAEAIKVIKSSPRWVPGKQGGKAVKQQFVLPIVFKLQTQ